MSSVAVGEKGGNPRKGIGTIPVLVDYDPFLLVKKEVILERGLEPYNPVDSGAGM